MRILAVDILVLGSSFSGSLLATILARIGYDVAVIDPVRHPRFAIGESSTPAADLVLGDLCDRYDLPELKPLTRYGTWRRERPEVRCGLKRGFSYFHHGPAYAGQGTGVRGQGPGEISDGSSHRSSPDSRLRFTPDGMHSSELLIAASASDEVSDTHWYRAEVDAYFAHCARERGVQLLEGWRIEEIQHGPPWTVTGRDDDGPMAIRAPFLIDSSGAAAVLPKWSGAADHSSAMHTSSRAVFAHFRGVAKWQDIVAARGGRVADHPFPSDAAALHHVVDGGWMWVLRFDGDITSAGFTLDTRRHPAPDGSAVDEWRTWLDRCPDIADHFRNAVPVAPFDAVIRSPRLQRHWQVPADAAERGWSILPGTVGFIDPFFSTGIAHSLIGIERVARAFEGRHQLTQRNSELAAHMAATHRELRLIDRFVATCYRTFGSDPRLLTAAVMLYFAGTHTWEMRRASAAAFRGDFVLADDDVWTAVAEDWMQRISMAAERGDPDAASQSDLAKAIALWNAAGLCNPDVNNMYARTATTKPR